MKKLSFVLTVFLILLVLSVLAFAADFYDIDNVPWEGAKDYINAVSDYGLMVGDTDAYGRKVFRAKDPVTCSETAQLIYTVLKSANIGTISASSVLNWADTLDTYSIPEWARPAVSYCLDNGIIAPSELSGFMSGGKQVPAKRETVALFFGRSLSYLVSSFPELTFKDLNDISQGAIPSVKALYALNIMIGDDNNNFNPKNNINRAEMAVVVSKSHVLTGGGTVIPKNPGETGTVISLVSLDSSSYMLTAQINGERKIFIGDSSVKVFKNNKDISFSDIREGDLISISYRNSIISSITVSE